jgi:cold-inducible RNA-binding protein
LTIYTGNLSREITETDLRDIFKTFGTVTFVNIIQDRFHKVPVGFGMVGMPIQVEAQAAIASLNGKELKGKFLVVNEAGIRSLSNQR